MLAGFGPICVLKTSNISFNFSEICDLGTHIHSPTPYRNNAYIKIPTVVIWFVQEHLPRCNILHVTEKCLTNNMIENLVTWYWKLVFNMYCYHLPKYCFLTRCSHNSDWCCHLTGNINLIKQWSQHNRSPINITINSLKLSDAIWQYRSG